MDYDDNDFQNQNLHLAGEGSAKFPPVLRPYALPKFDFDESLQANLRFDSLVETEVFLGIESNEDNQWIDTFSQGGSGIEFSSTAAESCSISRHGNVWSEATSSESVEMLLKSVGQEDYIPRQTVIQESDACDELACLAKQMDTNPKFDDKNKFKHSVSDLHPPGGTHTSFSGLKEDVGMEKPQGGVSQGHDGVLSIDGTSSNPELSDICRNIDLPVSDGSLTLDTNVKNNNTNQRQVETVDDDSHHGKTQDDSSAVQTYIAESSMTNMGDDKQDPLQAQTNNQDMESSVMDKEAVLDTQTLDRGMVGGDAHHLDKPFCSIPTEENLEGRGVVEGLETGISSLESSLRMESVAVSDSQKVEKSSEDMCFSALSQNIVSEDVMLLNDVVMDDQSVPNTSELPKTSIEDDSISEGQAVEVSNLNCENFPNMQQNVDVMEKMAYGVGSVTKEDELLNTGDHVDTVILSSKSEASVLTAEESNISTINEGNSDNMVGSFSSSSVTAFSTKSSILGESTQTCVNNEPDRQNNHEKCDQDVSVNDQDELLNTGDHVDTVNLSSKSEGSMFTAEENNISSISEGNSDKKVEGFSSSSVMDFSTKSSILGESTQICVNNESDGQHDQEKCDQVVSVNDQENERVPSDSSRKHCDVDKGVVSSSISEGSMEIELTTSTVSIDVTPVNNSVSQVVSENNSLTSHEIVDIPPSSKVVSTHEVTSHNEFQGITPVGYSSAEEKRESTAKADEAGTSTLVGSSEQETALCPVTGTEKHHSSDTLRELLRESDCQHNVGTGAIKIGEPQGTSNDEVIQECAKETGMPQVLCTSSEKQSDGVTVSLVKDGKDTVQENPDESSSEKLGGGSLSQTEKDKNQVEASANQNTQVSEVINGGAKNTLSTAEDLKENNASKDERRSTHEVNSVIDLSKKDVADDVGKMQPIPVTETVKTSSAMEGSPSTFGRGPSKTKSVGEVARGASKATPERKTRRASNKSAGKESSRRGSHAKDTTLARQTDRGDKSTNVSLSPSPGFQMMQSNEVQQFGHIDSNSTKSFAVVNTSTYSIPDLNTSASPPVLFHQPFTDQQQVQLRAQIFVYGALIQGMVPDEAYMISAFGGSDGGRSLWENAWRACMERQHGQKSHPANPETPLQSRSVARTSDLPQKQSAAQGKGISSPLGQTSSKATPPIVNPLIPLSSPLWSLSTLGLGSDSLQSSAIARGSVVDYPQAITPLHPYQTTPVRNFLGHNTPWMSQTPLRGPWITSPTPVPDNSPQISASPASDTIKLGSVKGSLPPSSGIKNVTSGVSTSSTGLQSIFTGTASLLDANNMTVSPAQHSSDPKPKKRKKVVVSEDLGQRVLQSLAPGVGSHTSTPVAFVAPVGNVPITTIEKSVLSVSPLADQSKNDRNVEKRIMLDESVMKVKEARVHAEEASALSAAAVNHSLELWNQLDKHKNSGLMPDIEAKLASAAVAVAAAAAIAKAAAAAANVASNAALQAKLMADEALLSSGYDNSSQSKQSSLSEGTNNLGKATPASILKGANGTNSPGSIIVAAKEAVKRRVEAASAATERAENMDAIVMAAELAAEAVSQAGKIVTMGDPLPISQLVEAGPEGCLKATRESSQQVGLFKDISRDMVNNNVRDIPETSYTHNRDILSGGISAPIKINEKNSRGAKGHKVVSDLVKPIDVVPGSEPEIQAPFTVGNGSENLVESSIKEGLLVEVFKDEEGFKAAWFSAKILTLKDNKAYVGYTSLVAAEGAGPLKEWVSLECDGDKPPRIRTARPLNTLQYEGTRKRRRAAMGDYAWSVGDRVDAWIQESWREGVITEKNKKDETTFTVHFPASGETLVVRAWHLRPSLIWKDGKWVESSKVGANDSSTHECDTPNEKRPKLGSHAVDVKGKDKMSKGSDAVESAKPDEMKLLNLAENDKVFNIGKSSKNENKFDAHRMVRTGLQKEGSKVIFGVPKPGKKRKFMEVSKHYVAHENSKISDRNDSVKLANFLMPPSSGPRGWKNSSKNDAKEKHGADSKPKTSHTERIKDSTNQFKNASQNESKVERAPHSASDGATGPILFSTLATSVDAHPTKRASSSRASKGKLAPAHVKSSKGEMEKALNDNPMKSGSDVVEPRRSNRRIQPTSRLLEGLQSSLIISKIPSVSHNRNTKS